MKQNLPGNLNSSTFLNKSTVKKPVSKEMQVLNLGFADDFYNQGSDNNDMGSYRKAMDCYIKAVEIDKECALGWQGQGDAAYAMYRLDPTSEEGHLHLSKAIEAYNVMTKFKHKYSDGRESLVVFSDVMKEYKYIGLDGKESVGAFPEGHLSHAAYAHERLGCIAHTMADIASCSSNVNIQSYAKILYQQALAAYILSYNSSVMRINNLDSAFNKSTEWAVLNIMNDKPEHIANISINKYKATDLFTIAAQTDLLSPICIQQVLSERNIERKALDQEHESKIFITQKDFEAFSAAIKPNRADKETLNQALDICKRIIEKNPDDLTTKLIMYKILHINRFYKEANILHDDLESKYHDIIEQYLPIIDSMAKSHDIEEHYQEHYAELKHYNKNDQFFDQISFITGQPQLPHASITGDVSDMVEDQF